MSLTPEQESELKEFLGRLGHELRAPLTSIQGYADIMLLSDPETVSPDILEMAEYIKDNCGHILTIIEEIKNLQQLLDNAS